MASNSCVMDPSLRGMASDHGIAAFNCVGSPINRRHLFGFSTGNALMWAFSVPVPIGRMNLACRSSSMVRLGSRERLSLASFLELAAEIGGQFRIERRSNALVMAGGIFGCGSVGMVISATFSSASILCESASGETDSVSLALLLGILA